MTTTLSAQTRTEKGRKTNALRVLGKVPAIVYGAGMAPRNVTVDRVGFVKTLEAAGESSLVELSVDGESPLHVLIHDTQSDPLRDEVTHVDFRAVDMNKEIETEVELVFVGDAPAVKTLGGTLINSQDKVKVRCLPSKLVRSIQVDVSKLATFDDVIRVSDLSVPDGVTILAVETLSLASVEPPRSEEELKALNEAVVEDLSTVEVAKEKKEEAVEGEEGAAAVAPATEKADKKDKKD